MANRVGCCLLLQTRTALLPRFLPSAHPLRPLAHTRTLRSLADLESMSSSTTITPPAQSDAPATAQPPALKPKKSSSSQPGIILTLSCPDAPGIVHRVTGYLATRGANIISSAQFGDASNSRFFMRVHASWSRAPTELAKLTEDFREELAGQMQMQFEMHSSDARPRTMIMVSKIGHCLNDLLFRLSTNALPIEVPLIVSNHPDYAPLAAAHNIPFIHLPIDEKAGKTKDWQEDQLLKLCEEYKIDLVVLARYMQILSPKVCDLMSGRIINIHHSFLPSFKGARPYHQAFERGVKLIGATAHIVTSDLDEGPIIEQDTERVTHAMGPNDLVRAGADVEARVLARAVRWYAERRVIQNGAKTIVFNN